MEENAIEETGLVNAVETENQEVNETSTETSVEDTKDFDASKFNTLEESANQEIENNNSETEETSANDKSDNEEFIDWDITNSEASNEETTENNEAQETTANEELETTNETDSTEVNESVSATIDYAEIGNKIGVEIKSEEDFVSYVQNLKERNKGSVTNDKINRLGGYLKLNDKELLEADLKSQGFNEAETKEAIETFTDNGTIKFEAKKIRNGLNRLIDNERNSVLKQQEANAKREEQEVEQLRSNIKNYIDNSKTMFGFKMAKDEATLKKVQENHYKYTTTEFYKDITKDEKSLAEAAWLWKHKDVILNAAKNKGLQKGKESVLNQMTNPDTNTSTRIREESTKEFDAKKFASY